MGGTPAFTSLAGAVITIDAMHTQTDTAEAIIARGADYVMTVKANMSNQLVLIACHLPQTSVYRAKIGHERRSSSCLGCQVKRAQLPGRLAP